MEPLEIVAAHGDVAEADDLFGGETFQVHDVARSAEALIYHVTIPRHLRVRPPDWRDLAYDHEAVRRCIGVCVTDNCRSFMAEPIDAHLFLKIEKTLYLVRRDLGSIMDLTSVTCEPAQTPGRYVVCVAFEYKHGTSQTLTIEIDNGEGFREDET